MPMATPLTILSVGICGGMRYQCGSTERLGTMMKSEDGDCEINGMCDPELYIDSLDPSMIVDGLTWYCPNGHEVYRPVVPERFCPECGTCGASMSTNSDNYYNVIGEIEEEGIARYEQKAQSMLERSSNGLNEGLGAGGLLILGDGQRRAK